jgi:hypothetical protein
MAVQALLEPLHPTRQSIELALRGAHVVLIRRLSRNTVRTGGSPGKQKGPGINVPGPPLMPFGRERPGQLVLESDYFW